MDEADRLLDPSFEQDLRVLLALLPDPAQRQTLLFSATLTPSLVKLQQASLADAYVFQVSGGAHVPSNVAIPFFYPTCQ